MVMIYLFSEAGQAALRHFIDASTLFAFDLDGTLAPIVPEPDGILIPEEIRNGLIRLNRIAPVAIITGRGRADARRHLGFKPRFLVGNHGAEGLPGKERQEKSFRDLCAAWQHQLAGLMPHAAEAGIIIENKGASLSVHYRKAKDRTAAADAVRQAIHRLEPSPKRVPGLYVENIIPDDAPHKGDALLQLMHQAGCSKALFVGDDVTDEDVFALANDSIFGIRVGCEAKSAAVYHLSGQTEFNALLSELIRLLG